MLRRYAQRFGNYVNRNVRRVRGAVRERLREFARGLLADELNGLRDRISDVDNAVRCYVDETAESVRDEIPTEDDWGSANEDAIQKAVESALENYDFTDAIADAIGDYDFSDDIENALNERNGADNPAERLAELFRGLADELESGSNPPRRKRR